jgi:ABC-type thiamine transport system substrate-binding protein
LEPDPGNAGGGKKMNENVIKKKTSYTVYLVVGLVIVAGGLIYLEYGNIIPQSEPVINILTYGSFFQYGSHPNKTLNYIIGNFEKWYHVKINLIYSSGDLYSQVTQSGGKGYDIVIGLNNIDSYLLANSRLFYRFHVSNETYLNNSLYSYLGSQGEMIPYEYSFLTTDYNYSGPIPASEISNLSFTDLYNYSFSSQYILENPTTSINGEEFLLGQIAFYNGIMRQNWTTFWKEARGIQITSDWSSGFSLFEEGKGQMFFSYETDPAYNDYFNYSKIGTTPFHYDGRNYSWLEILGLGILNSSAHKAIDEEFVNWFIGKNVESLIPLNEWTYPASMNVALPPVYSDNPPASSIIPLNGYLNYSSISRNMSGWLLEWSQLESQT